MSARLHFLPPVVFCRRGNRPENQDFTIPREGDALQNYPVYLVCDGVGGQKGGKIASRMVAESLETWFREAHSADIDPKFVRNGIRIAEQQLINYAAEKVNYGNMSTTLALACPTDQGALLLAWAGDSAVLHIRDGTVKFRTRDHTLVNDYIDQGIIRPEEAATHKKRNIITNCLSANWRPANPEVRELADLYAGDAILLCSDGVLEAIPPESLASWLDPHFMDIPQNVANRIADKCLQDSRDNYSMILLIVA